MVLSFALETLDINFFIQSNSKKQNKEQGSVTALQLNVLWWTVILNGSFFSYCLYVCLWIMSV